MSGHGFIKAAEGGCTLEVDVSPGAKRTEIAGVNKWRGSLKIRVASAPEQGKANDDLCEFLKEMLCLEDCDCRVVKGVRSRHKRIFVGLSPEEAYRRMRREK